MKLIVIGSAPAVWGFALAGVRGEVVTTETELVAALDRARAAPDVGIVWLTGDVVDLARAHVNALMARSEVPLIVEIPAPAGVSSNRPSLQETLRRTIGIRI